MRVGGILGCLMLLAVLAAACGGGEEGSAADEITPTTSAPETAISQGPSPTPSRAPLPGESCEKVEAGAFSPGVYIIDPERCEVAHVTDGRSDGNPAWSPDSKQFAFVRLETPSVEGDAELLVVNSDGSGLRQLTETEGERESAPAWSPDGSTIAFATLSLGQIASTPEEGLNEEEWTYDLKVLEVDNPQNVRTLVTDLGCFGYTWSPDSQRLAVVSSCRQRGLFIVDVANGELRQLADDAVPSFTHEWSPDGTRITYRCREPGAAEYQRDVCVISRDGGSHVVLARERYFDPGPGGSSELRVAAGASPSWTPDGRHVAFAGTGGELYFVDPEDGRLDRVVDGWRGEFKITWLSEGVASAHICTGDVVPCSWETIVVDLFTSEWRSLLRESCSFSSRWSPDGTLLSFVVGEYGVACL